MSIKPGETTRPEASIIFKALFDSIFPILMISSPIIPISRILDSFPEPSNTSPLIITIS